MAVTTVLGEIPSDQLGLTIPHEHIFIDMEVFFVPPDEIGDRQMAFGPVTMDKLGILKRNPFAVKDNVVMTDAQTQYDEMMHFKIAGGRSVVDASTVGLGRDPLLLREMAVRTGLNIIAGAGFYVDGSLPESVKSMSIEAIERQIVRETTQGIGHTDIKAGIIGEIGVSYEMTPFEKKSLTAACRAQRTTGLPLMIHINPWSTQGIAAMEIVDAEKVPHEKVAICHIDVENRREYILRLLDMGVYVEFDNFGKEMFTDRWNCKPGSGRFVNDWERVLLVKELLDRGFEKQLLLSTDICLKTLLHAYGGWGYDHVLTHIAPMLDEVGVTSSQMNTLLIENPLRWLG